MNKLVMFGFGVAAGYMLNKFLTDGGPGSPVPGGIENGGVVSGRSRWVAVRPYARRIGVGAPHTIILPPANISSWQPGPSGIGYSGGLM